MNPSLERFINPPGLSIAYYLYYAYSIRAALARLVMSPYIRGGTVPCISTSHAQTSKELNKLRYCIW